MSSDAKLARLVEGLQDIAPRFDQRDRAAFALSLAEAIESGGEGGSPVVRAPAGRTGLGERASFRLN